MTKSYFLPLAVFITVLSYGEYSFAQPDRKVAVLDMTNYNGETGTSRKLSAIRVMRLAGIPFDTTSSLYTALTYPVIITGSRIQNGAFTVTEQTDLENYVSTGGVLISSNLSESDHFDLFGISSSNVTDTVFRMVWDTISTPIFQFVDDSLEVEISLGDTADPTAIQARFYDLAGGTAIAHYDDGTVAVVMDTFGLGYTYLFGPDFRDLLFRNQINYDYNAQRTYSNGFEPSSDVIMIVLRNIARRHIPHSVSKHTIPGTLSSVVMFTHDIDSHTGMDTMLFFSDYQQGQGIKGHYNITTRYFVDELMSDFYVGSFANVDQVRSEGHTLASHSVGHFPDFNDEPVFNYGALGNTMFSYTPSHFGGVTTGGTVLGELEVSKELIESDHGVAIRSFRAGHLCYHDSLAKGLEETGYEFNSTHSANNVLSNYPFYAMSRPSFSSDESSVLEIPMTLSDVFPVDPISASNYVDKVDIWVDATVRYSKNHAPIVILIHPNRMYKLTAMQDYISALPVKVLDYGFEDYGDYWKQREALDFHTEYSGDTLRIILDAAMLSIEQSFVVDWDGTLDTIEFLDESGTPIDFDYNDWDTGQRLYYQYGATDGIKEEMSADDGIVIFPNPTNGLLNIRMPFSGNYSAEILDLNGRQIAKFASQNNFDQINLMPYSLENGTYVIDLKSEDYLVRKLFFYSRE